MSRRPFRSVLLALPLLALAASPVMAKGPGVVKFDERSIEVGEAAGSVRVVVERSNGEDGAISVVVSTAGGTATAGADYGAVTTLLSWADGEEAVKAIEVPIVDDGDAEPTETVGLILSSPTGGAQVDRERGHAQIRIHDNDGGPGGPGGGKAGMIKFDQRGFRALESGGVAVITVERSKGEDGAVSIDYATSDGSATEGEDYTGVAGTLFWEDGDGGSKTFRVPILADDRKEPSETVRLTLSNPTGGATLQGHNAMLVIHDDDRPDDEVEDGPGEFEFKVKRPGFQVREGGGTALITVKRSHGEEGAVSVDYSTADGSATDGEDYTGVAGTLSWGHGEGGSRTFTVPVHDDDEPEGNETVLLTLANPTGGATIDDEHGEAELLVLDDDGDTAPCAGADTVLCLQRGRFRVEVVWRTQDGATGSGHAVRVSDRAGLFWFFHADNIEMLFKLLDACDSPFEAYWVFFAATTNVDFAVTVTDTATGLVKQYENPAGQAAEPVQDTLTFLTCP